MFFQSFGPQSGIKIRGAPPPRGPSPRSDMDFYRGGPAPSGREPARRKLQRRQKSREIYKAVSVYWKLKLTRNVEIISMPPCACMTHNSSTYLRCSQLFHNVNNSKQQDPAVTLTLPPLDKSALQICFPIPCAPPVTMATLPWIFIP